MDNLKKTKLTLNEIYELEAEISGYQIEDKKIYEGVLNHKLPIVLKYYLKKLQSILKEEKTLIEDSRAELIKKFGKERDDGNIVIEPFVVVNETDEEGKGIEKRLPNENFLKFQEEYQKLLSEEKEVEHYVFKIEDFSELETDDNYTVFYKLFD